VTPFQIGVFVVLAVAVVVIGIGVAMLERDIPRDR
jgi:hypothetical protein